MASPQRFLVGGLLAFGLFGQEAPRAVSPLRSADPALPRRIPDSVREAPVPAAYSAGPLSPAEARLRQRGPLTQTGVRRAVPPAALENVVASSFTPEGRAVLTVSLRSPGARGLRLHFQNFNAGTGEVWVFAPGDLVAFGPYTGRGIFGTGDFWAAHVDSDTAIVAYRAPLGTTPARLPFTIDALTHARPAAAATNDPAAPCNLDVTCYPEYQTAANASVEYEFVADDGSGTYSCSGAMINTRSSSLKPYLLTAHHCIAGDAEARTIEVHFLYQTASCNGTPPNRSFLPTVLGGAYLAGAPIAEGDFALVLLPGVPGGVTFLGWNAALDAAASVTGIHHPRGNSTRISFGNRGADRDVTIGNEVAPAPLYYEVDWTSGVTEPGSSGSPLLDAHGAIVGTLTAASAPPPGETVCDIHPFSFYGRFSNAYAALRSYLEDGPAAPPRQSLVSVVVNPNPIYQQTPDADGFQWSYTLRIAESGGVSARLTSFRIDSTDYTTELQSIFGGATLPAFGTLSVKLRAKDLPVPMTCTFELDGVDAGTGRAWQAYSQAPFLGPKVRSLAPVITAGGLGSAASYMPAVAPGSLLAIFGANLAVATATAPAVPLPLDLGGTSVTIDGYSAPIFAASPGQLNVQVPFEVAPGTARVTVTVGGESDTQPVQVLPVAPAVFALDGVHPWPFAGGHRGDSLTLFLTGQGPLSPAIATGAAPPLETSVDQLPRFAQPARITIGSRPAPIRFAGIPSGLVSIAQINFQVPPDAPLGDQPLVVSVGDQPARPVTFTVAE